MVIMLEYQNIKTLLQKAVFKIGLEKLLLLKMLKILWRGHLLLVTLKAEKLLEHFTKKNCKKTNQTEFRVEKWWKEKAINYMLNGKATIILLTVGLIKKT